MVPTWAQVRSRGCVCRARPVEAMWREFAITRHHATIEPPLVPCRLRRPDGPACVRRAESRACAEIRTCARALAAPGAGAHRRRHHRRRRRRHRRGAAHRCRRAPSRCSRRPTIRRPLHHRHAHLRRAVRPRRALDPHAGHQSGGQARLARPRYLSGAAGPEAAHRPALCARRRAGGFPAAGARNRAIADAARKADVPCAQALPKDLGDWRQTIEFMLGPTAAARTSRRSRPWTRPLGRARQSTRSAGRASARCWRSSPPVSRSSCPTPVTRDRLAPERRGGDTGGNDRRARPASSPSPPTCLPPARSSSRRICRSASSMPAQSSRSAATTTSRWSCRQSARAAARRPGVREIDRHPHRRDARQRLRHAALHGRGRRQLRPRSRGQGRGRHGRFRHRLARRPFRRGRQEGDQAHATPRAGTTSRGRWAHSRPPRPARRRAPHPDGAAERPPSGSPAKRRTRPCGARSAAPGNPASAPPTPCCAGSARRRSRASAEAGATPERSRSGRKQRRSYARSARDAAAATAMSGRQPRSSRSSIMQTSGGERSSSTSG